MAIEIVDFPIKNGGSFHCYVSLPEGNQHEFLQHGFPHFPPPFLGVSAAAGGGRDPVPGLAGDLALPLGAGEGEAFH